MALRTLPCLRPRTPHSRPAPPRAGSDLFLDPGRFARQVAQVVQLGASHAAPALHGDLADSGAVHLKDALDALTMRNLANGERGVEAAVALGNHDAFVRLHTLAVAFYDLHL